MAVLVEVATRAHLGETVRAWEVRQLVHGGVEVLDDGREMQNHRNFDHVVGVVLVVPNRCSEPFMLCRVTFKSGMSGARRPLPGLMRQQIKP